MTSVIIATGLEDEPRDHPIWDSAAKVLSFNGQVVKQYKWPAPNQEKLLNAFVNAGWPVQIHDPLTVIGFRTNQELHDTVKCLNRNQVTTLLEFQSDAVKQKLSWHAFKERSN